MQNYVQLTQLVQFQLLRHAFGTREAGNLGNTAFTQQDTKLMEFLRQFQISISDCVAMNQIHKDHIEVVDSKDKGTILPMTDGLITLTPKLLLLTKTADCMPVLFYESKIQAVGIAHLGFRGTLLRLGSKMIKKMVELGGKAEHLYVGVGPHIQKCCYNCSHDRLRIEAFEREFINGNDLCIYKNEGIFINLLRALELQILEEGVAREHFFPGVWCTSCEVKTFFSARADSNDTGLKHGENISLIGMA